LLPRPDHRPERASCTFYLTRRIIVSTSDMNY
jgi:hypothetical protein